MVIRIRSLVCIGLLLFVSMVSTFASEKPVSIQIRPASESIKKIHYQSGAAPDKSWKIAPLSSPIVLEDFASDTDFLFVQQAEKDEVWGDLYSYQYDRQTNKWSVDEPPNISSPAVHVGAFGGLLFTGEDTSHLYKNSFGGGAEISISFSKLHVLANAQIHTAKANNIWADTYTILSLTGGLGYTIFDYKKSELTAIGRFGLITHWNGSTWYFNPRGELGLRLSQGVSEQIRPFIEGGVLVMFTNSSNTILYNGSVGIQYTI